MDFKAKQSNQDLFDYLMALTKDELTIIARKLKVPRFSKFNKDELINEILKFPEEKIRPTNVTWWKKYHNHVYGSITTLALIFGVVFYLATNKDMKTIKTDSDKIKDFLAPERNPELFFKTVRIENTDFVYNTEPWKFDVDDRGEDMYSSLNPHLVREGLATIFVVSSSFPRISANNIIVEYTIENHSKALAILDEMYVEVTNVYEMPEAACYNKYLPVLIPSQDSIVIEPTVKSKYQIFKGKTYKYSHNETDKFRLEVSLLSNTTKIVEFQVKGYYRIKNEKQMFTSDKKYLIAIPPEIKKEQREKQGKVASEFFNKVFDEPPSWAKITDSIKNGRISEAEMLLSTRLDLLQTTRSPTGGTVLIRIDGPREIACWELRFYCRLYLHKIAEAKLDMQSIVKHKSIRYSNELEHIDEIYNAIHKSSEAGKIKLLLHFANAHEKTINHKY